MTEILTESFCERCGTRYTFESAAPRQRRMGGLKVLGRGLKNFVMSDDSSLDEAFAAARSDVERDATSQQLDAFHRTFNFCMSCRQYTCANCWNEVEARCLSCAPLALADSAAVLDDVDPERLRRLISPASAESPVPSGDSVAAAHVHAPEMVGAEAGAAEDAITDEARADVHALAPAIEVLDPAATEPTPAESPEAAADTIGGMVPGQTIDDALAAYEASQAPDAPAAVDFIAPAAAKIEAAAESAAQLETPADETEQPATITDVPADGVAAAAAAPTAEPVEAAAPEVAVAGSPGVDVIAQPVWPIATPGMPAPPASGPASTPAAPAWPTGPRWPTAIPARQEAPPSPAQPGADPLAALISRSTTEAMWAASSHDVIQPVVTVQATAAVQPCVNCGISLSATARFCRRCGTSQG